MLGRTTAVTQYDSFILQNKKQSLLSFSFSRFSYHTVFNFLHILILDSFSLDPDMLTFS